MSDPLAVLQRIRETTPRPVVRAGERCELCGAELPMQHDHLVEIASRKLLCACGACAILFDGQVSPRYRRVPHNVQALDGFAMSDAGPI